MTAQKGRDLLVKLDITGQGSYRTVAGLRATGLSFSTETVNITTFESPEGWRELLAGAGTKSVTISGSGVFRDDRSDARIRELFFKGEHAKLQIVIPDFGTMAGPFQISALEYAGTFDGEVTHELTLNSAGVIGFTSV